MAKTADDWARLGRIVRKERKAQGFRDTTKWADAVGRSSRVLLGLERGEPTGHETLELVSEALNKDAAWCELILDDRRWTEPVGPGAETAGFVAFPDPAADPADRPVTERRLAEEMSRVFEALDRIEKKLPRDGA